MATRKAAKPTGGKGKNKPPAPPLDEIEEDDPLEELEEEEEEEEEEEDLLEGLDPKTQRAFEGFSGVLADIGKRLKTVEAYITSGHNSAGTTGHVGGIGPGGRPGGEPPMIRGRYGECEPVDVAYSYIKGEVRDRAMAGTLPPEMLPALIPPRSHLHREPPAEEENSYLRSPGGTLRPRGASKRPQDAVSRFVAAIPNPAVFWFAWSILMDLMMAGLGEHQDHLEMYRALSWYGRWIGEQAARCTWESVCQYHLDACATRFTGRFHTSMWYGALDTVASVHLVRKEAAVVTASGSSGVNPNPSKRRKTASEKRDTSDEVCYAYNTTGCRTPCKHGRQHACLFCGKAHSAKKCTVRGA